MKWFNGISTAEELKKAYKKLALKYHPDRPGGDLKAMQEINAEYDEMFARIGKVHMNSKGETYTKETSETPEIYRNIIDKLIKLDGIQIEICGTWLWITGETKKHKEILKSIGFNFSRSKIAWYFHFEPYVKRGKKKYTLSEIRSLYGSEVITGEPELKVTIV